MKNYSGRPLLIRSCKAKALLAYLAWHKNTPITRSELVELLWDGEEKARHRLRQTLLELRKQISEELIIRTQDTLCISDQLLNCDVNQFQILAQSKIIKTQEAALRLYRGDFLQYFDPLSISYEAWIIEKNVILREIFRLVAYQLLSQYQQLKLTHKAIALSHKILLQDPLDEPIYPILMQLYQQEGRRIEAIRLYENYQKTLKKELNIEPDPKIRRLYQQLVS